MIPDLLKNVVPEPCRKPYRWLRRAGKQPLRVTLALLGLKKLYWRINWEVHAFQAEWNYEQCRRFFEAEREYHRRILSETDYDMRMKLYTEAYDAIFGMLEEFTPGELEFGFCPDIINKYSEIFEGKTVVDYGCGYGSSTALLSSKADFVYGVDISGKCISEARREFDRGNVEFVLASGMVLPQEDRSIDAVYSNDLLEHLHPEDFRLHLSEVHRVLKPGGQYLLWTPGARSGPHDCTSLFYPRGMGFKAKGSHLKEYTFEEIRAALEKAGYSRIDFPEPSREVLAIATK